MASGHAFPTLLLLSLLVFQLANASPQPKYDVYIVHVDPQARPAQFSTPERWYTYLLNGATGIVELEMIGYNPPQSDRLLFVYKNGAIGFAARLTSEEAEKLSGLPGVLNVLKDGKVQIHSTVPAA